MTTLEMFKTEFKALLEITSLKHSELINTIASLKTLLRVKILLLQGHCGSLTVTNACSLDRFWQILYAWFTPATTQEEALFCFSGRCFNGDERYRKLLISTVASASLDVVPYNTVKNGQEDEN